MHAVAHCGSSHPAVSPLPVTVITEEKIKEVGGRLKKFKDEWPTIYPDKWVVNFVRQGYKIEFTSPPPIRQKVLVTRLPANESQRKDLLTEVDSLLGKEAIYKIEPPYQKGYRSSFVQAPKKTGGWRPILNLKPLNQFIKPKKFRMESLSVVLKAPIKGRGDTSIDLKDHTCISLFTGITRDGYVFRSRARRMPLGPTPLAILHHQEYLPG